MTENKESYVKEEPPLTVEVIECTNYYGSFFYISPVAFPAYFINYTQYRGDCSVYGRGVNYEKKGYSWVSLREKQIYQFRFYDRYDWASYFNCVSKIVHSQRFQRFIRDYGKCENCNIGSFICPSFDKTLCSDCHEEWIKKGSPSNKMNQVGYVYVISTTDGKSKIGMTKGEPQRRLKELQTASSCELTLRGYIETHEPGSVERLLHKQFHKHRLKGEWFNLPYESIKNQSNLEFFDHRLA